jgi:hypothetical protein
MAIENHLPDPAPLSRLLTLLLNSSWPQMVMQVWKTARKILRGMADEGMYEVLEYESTLELKDKRGERALVRKYEKVRYLQNHIIAYQDEAWGDGEILINYRCAPGVPVDRYRPGKKTYILISLREVKNRSDVDEFHIQWEMKNGFRRKIELWDARINHRMQHLRLKVIFPSKRPPLRVWLVEETTQKAFLLGDKAQTTLPDGRWQVEWETQRPRRHESYALKWEW